MQDTQEYNGWTNKATWLVNLWLQNDEPMYREWQRCKSKAELQFLVRGIISNHVVTDPQAREGFMSDLIGRYDSIPAALAEVDWDEVWKAHEED